MIKSFQLRKVKRCGLWLSLAASFIVFFSWISVDIFTHADWRYNFTESQAQEIFISSWNNSSLGQVNLTLWRAPLDFFYGLFAQLGVPFNVSDKILVFWLIIFLFPFASYIFIKKIFPSELAGFTGVIVIIFNSYYLSIATQGHILLTVATIFSIFSLFFFDRFLEDKEKNRRWGILFVITLFVSTYYDLRIGYITIFLLLGYYFFYSLRSRTLPFLEIFILFLIFGVLNLYWAVPFILTDSFTQNPWIVRSLFGNDYWNLSSAITLHHPFWSGGQIQWFVVQKIPLIYWLIPVFATVGFMLNRRNHKVIFFSVVLLIGILLTKQVDIPFQGLYPWLFNNIPGFNSFREASKFYLLILLGYSVLIAGFVHWAWIKITEERHQHISLLVGVTVIIGVFLWNVAPLISGQLGTLFVPRTIPNDYHVLRENTLEQPNYFRTLYVPAVSRWAIYLNHKPIVGLWSPSEPSLADLYAFQHGSNNSSLTTRLFATLNDPLLQEYLNVFSIGRVVVPIQDIRNDVDTFRDYGGRDNPDIRLWYIEQLDQIEWLEKIDIGTEELVVYENSDFRPHVFSFNTLFEIDSTEYLENKYEVITGDLENDFYFQLSNEYKSAEPTRYLVNPFENISPASIDGAESAIRVSNPKSMSNKVDFVLERSVTNGELIEKGNEFIYSNEDYSFVNILPNPSFESESWREEVGDCHNYDDNPILAMRLNTEEKTDGDQSLQLEATRHIACTAIRIDIESGASYLFSFDYQSSNAKRAAYYLGFNDPHKTTISEDVPITNKEWSSFSKVIKAPEDATQMSLYIYAKSVDEKTNIINRYDNFNLIEIPDLSDAFYLVSEPERELVEPKSITFNLVNPTKKLVHIQGAATPFFLAMSESYHDQWQLQFNNEKVRGFFDKWWPFVKPDRVGNEYHYKLNGFLNGWYVDVDEYCRTQELCVQNEDGTYDIEMVIEFFPQRWFYLGLLISGTTLAGCLGYLGYVGVKSLKLKVKRRKNPYVA